MEEQPTSEDPSLVSSEALSGLLSVVNALCTGKTGNSYDNENDDDNDSCNDGDDHGNDDATVMGKDDGDGKGCSLESGCGLDNNINIKELPSSHEIKETTSSKASRSDSSSDSEELRQQLKRQAETQDSSPIPAKKNHLIDVPTYLLDETRIVIFPDVYAAIRKACGTCSSLRGKIMKLGIVAKRFQPWEMTRLKHVGAIGLEVKCCSYIDLEEFLQIIHNYRDIDPLCPEMFNFLYAVTLNGSASTSLEEKVGRFECSVLDSRSSRLTSSPLHTFIVDDEVVVCTVELQQVFEALFGKVLCVSLTKLGIFQKKFTHCQLDEVMDFVDIDESSVSAASFYVAKKDVERVFRYAEALFNVEQVTVRWMEPLRLTNGTSLANKESSDSNIQGFNTGGVATLQRVASSIPASGRHPTTIHCTPDIQDCSNTETRADEGTAYCPSNPLYSSSDESRDVSVQGSPSRVDMSELFEAGTPSDKLCVSRSNADDMAAFTRFQAENGSPSSFKVEKDRTDPALDSNEKTKFQNMAGREQVLESCAKSPAGTEMVNQSASSSGLYPTNEEYPSSPNSENSSISELGPYSSIRTYQIDGNEVVCIPDIHKIVILLYGQSVQVGYYLQRLQIPTQRFSTVHVKRLKALNALNSKATLCTYILKSDAQRLLKMYDVFCTESKLQQIQWCNPVSLDAYEGAIPFREEAPSLPVESVKSKPTDPVAVVKIPTFKINGEVVVSVPDAHKVVQVLNGQSVQVRYNMDKLGIVKRKYSYSQVYQLRAISDLKRPSMCTFITKTDADKLLAHYLTAENASRLNYIQWIPPVQLEELNTSADGVSISQDAASNTGRSLPVMINAMETVVSDGESKESYVKQQSFNYERPSDAAKDMETFMKEQRANQLFPPQLDCGSHESTFIRTPSSIIQNDAHHSFNEQVDEHQNYRKQGSALLTLDSVRRDEGLLPSTSAGFPGTCNQGTTRDRSSSCPPKTGAHIMDFHNEGTTRDHLRHAPLLSGTKASDSSPPASLAHSSGDKTGTLSTVATTTGGQREDTGEDGRSASALSNLEKTWLHEERRDKDSMELEIKRLRAEKEEIAATLERKETEMKILHDAYQQQVACERENRLKADKDAAELRASNEELKKNLQRKESEMKILHDSYQYQIRKERERREEMENELTDLRGQSCFGDRSKEKMETLLDYDVDVSVASQQAA